MAWKAQNEMRAWNGMPVRVRLSDGLGIGRLWDMKHITLNAIWELPPITLGSSEPQRQ